MHPAILKSVAAAAAIVAPSILIPSAASAAASPEGIWIDANGRGAVEIKPCGEALCGHVVWLKNSTDAKGCGKQIIGDAAASGSAYTGWIYSPEDKKRYNVDISPTRDGRLKVVGYAGMRLFSKTMYWTPADPNLARCDAQQASTSPKPAPASQAQTAVTTTPAATAAPAVPAPATAAKEPAPNSAKVAAVNPPAPASKFVTQAPSAAAAIRAGMQPQALAKPAEVAGAQKPSGDAASAPAPGAEDEAQTAEMAEKPNLKRLAGVLDKVLKKSGNGDCKLDLPWLKVEFHCEDE